MNPPQSIESLCKTLSSEENLLFEFQFKVLQYLKPYLYNQLRLEDELGKMLYVKDENNRTFDYDLAANNLLLDTLKARNFKGEVFSEETKWTKFGTSGEVIITDPICNSSLLRRGFRNVASGVTFFRGKEFIAGALTDFGTQIMCIASATRVLRVGFVGDNEVVVSNASVSGKKELEDAFVVLSLYSQEYRKEAIKQRLLLEGLPLIVEVMGGQPNWARLTQGSIDAYISPFHGTRIYELAAGEIAKRAGAVLRDLGGNEIEMGSYIEVLRRDDKHRIKFIAAASEELCQEIRKLL